MITYLNFFLKFCELFYLSYEPEGSWELPEFVTSWSEVWVAWDLPNLWLVS